MRGFGSFTWLTDLTPLGIEGHIHIHTHTNTHTHTHTPTHIYKDVTNYRHIDLQHKTYLFL